MIDEAIRGNVYKFDDGKGNREKLVLVVSSNARARDRKVSTIMLGDSPYGHDVVSFADWYLHCGLVTYTNRDKLTEFAFGMPDDVMQEVDLMLSKQLGIDFAEELNFTKQKYQELLNTVVGVNDNGSSKFSD